MLCCTLLIILNGELLYDFYLPCLHTLIWERLSDAHCVQYYVQSVKGFIVILIQCSSPIKMDNLPQCSNKCAPERIFGYFSCVRNLMYFTHTYIHTYTHARTQHPRHFCGVWHCEILDLNWEPYFTLSKYRISCACTKSATGYTEEVV